jgi:hypothetical protein
MSVAFAHYAPWIIWFESTFRNIKNPASTAEGYFQIIIGTWREFAPKVPGATQYAQANLAPYLIQYAVAEQIYLGQGIKAWATWEKIEAAVAG